METQPQQTGSGLCPTRIPWEDPGPPGLCPEVLRPDRCRGGEEEGEGRTGACDLVGVGATDPAGGKPLVGGEALFFPARPPESAGRQGCSLT